MERKFYTDNFEQLLKEKSDEFRMYPSKRVWHSIYNDLHPGRKWPSIAMSMLLIIALLLIGYLNTSDNTNTKNPAEIAGLSNGSGNNTTGNAKTPLIETLAGSNHQPEVVTTTMPGNTVISTNDITALNNAYNIPAANNGGNESANSNSSVNRIYANDNLVESLDNYINSSRLLTDVAALNRKNDLKKGNGSTDVAGNNQLTGDNTTDLNNATSQNAGNKISAGILNTKAENNKALTANEGLPAKANTAGNKKIVSMEEKAWMEDYALHNKPGHNKWKDRISMEIYATPNIGYRNLTSNVKNEVLANSLTAGTGTGSAVDKTMNQKPALGLEAGVGLSYSLTKNILVKAGVQLNYTNYSIKADETNHPILTTLLMNDENSGNPYLSSRTSTLSNSSGLQPVTLHNKTYQFSVPVGAALKLAGNNNMSWYVGASVQPTFVIGGTANLISSDYKNYISDPTLLRRWNMNTSVETYVNYKLGGYTLQVGPQFRYQLLSTYNKKYTFNEKLYNVGLKVGLVKSF